MYHCEAHTLRIGYVQYVRHYRSAIGTRARVGLNIAVFRALTGSS